MAPQPQPARLECKRVWRGEGPTSQTSRQPQSTCTPGPQGRARAGQTRPAERANPFAYKWRRMAQGRDAVPRRARAIYLAPIRSKTKEAPRAATGRTLEYSNKE